MAITSADLVAVDTDGLINEDVMQRIWDISRIPLPVQDMIGTDRIGNETPSWVKDRLADPISSNAKADGADTINDDDTKLGERVQNHAQTATKTVAVSTRGRDSDTIAHADELANQLMRRQQELRRDVDRQMLTPQASVKSNPPGTPGVSGGLDAWLTSNTLRGATGSDGGYNFTTGLVDAPTAGTLEPLTETRVRDIAESVWTLGGNPSEMLARPKVIRGLSEYMFTSSARIATLTSETTQSQVAATAKGSVNVFLTDFEVVLKMRANRLQEETNTGGGTGGADGSTLFILDPAYLRQGILTGYRSEELAKSGLADNRHIIVDYTLKVLNEEAHGLIGDIDEGAAVTT